MKILTNAILICPLVAILATPVPAQTIPIRSGGTSVLLGGTQEEQNNLAAAGLSVTGIAGDTRPSATLPGGVEFPIASDSTFLFTDSTVAPVSGAIEHTGTVLVNSGPPTNLGSLEIGDFSISFDANRVDSASGATGFFVADTFNPLGPLFDLSNLSVDGASSIGLVVGADLLVSPELATILGNSALGGADIGDALINGFVPEPTCLMIGGLAAITGVLLGRGTRRRM